MEAMVGYERAIVIDAAHTGDPEPGTILSVSPADLRQSRNACSNHRDCIEAALELGILAGLPLPRDIRIWAVEAADVATFGDRLTAPPQSALPALIANILRSIEAEPTAFQEGSP